MRMSASGLASTIAVAIDQILRLAPSISPPLEPVVSRTKAPSTVGLGKALEKADDNGKAASASARAGIVMTDLMVFLQWAVPPRPGSVRLAGESCRKQGRGADKFYRW